MGELGLDSTSFFKSTKGKSDTLYTFSAGPRFSKTQGNVEYTVDVTGYVYTKDRKSLTFEGDELFLQTGPNLLKDHHISLGRKKVQWSMADQEWKMGLWEPRFIWDVVHPKSIGLTGLFYRAEADNWGLLLFATGISPPERGVPVVENNAQISSTDPFWSDLPNTLVLPNTTLNVKYRIEQPGLAEAILRPGLGLKLNYGAEHGFWTSVNYGYLPIHQVDIAINGYVEPSGNYVAEIKPLFQNHHLGMLESGFRSNKWDAWIAEGIEIPDQQIVPSYWMYQPRGMSVISSFGVKHSPVSRLWAGISYLRVDEEKPSPIGPFNIRLPLPSRYDYNNSLKTSLSYDLNYKIGFQSSVIRNFNDQSMLTSLDSSLRWIKNTSIYLGLDIFSGGERHEKDRVRGGLTYVF